MVAQYYPRVSPRLKDRAVTLYHQVGRGPERARRVNAVLVAEGLGEVPRSSLIRWVSAAKGIPIEVERAATATLPPKTEVARARAAGELDDIPAAILEAIGPRMLIVAQGKGLERVEDAIGKMADAISALAPQVAEQLLDTEEESQSVKKDGEIVTATTTRKAQAAKNVVGALQTLATAMQMVTASRVARSGAFRNFAEGDQLSGVGAKSKAEAETIRQAAAADGAKDITPRGGPAHRPLDQDYQDEAMAALADIEKGR